MKAASKVANMSASRVVKVGATLYHGNRFISAGYNGWGFKGELEDKDGNTIPGVPHAEEVCIGMAAKRGESTKNSTMYVTTAPCFACARLMVVAGIKTVYYKNDWWDKAVLDYLKEYNVEVICTKRGLLIDGRPVPEPNETQPIKKGI